LPADVGGVDLVLGQEVVCGALSVVVKSYHVTEAFVFYLEFYQATVAVKAQTGHGLLILEASVRNAGGNTAFEYASRIRVVDQEGVTYTPELIGAEGALPGYVQLNPGERVDGFLVYEVPLDRKINRLKSTHSNLV